jgi:hypothetical protein
MASTASNANASRPEEGDLEESYPASVRITRVRVYALYD